ncbi:MAG: anti-sigma-I factor RsgI family protein [Christensenellales bacterium]|jgi:hypothetical protein
MKKLLTVLACTLVIALCIGIYPLIDKGNQANARGGVLWLSVNPQISVYYDAGGNVTNVEARNEDGTKILADFTGFEGKACKSVVAELVTAIGKAGYFVEEVEGGRRRITLEIVCPLCTLRGPEPLILLGFRRDRKPKIIYVLPISSPQNPRCFSGGRC